MQGVLFLSGILDKSCNDTEEKIQFFQLCIVRFLNAIIFSTKKEFLFSSYRKPTF